MGSCAASDGLVLFVIQLTPFVVLLGYLLLERWDILSVDRPASDHAPAALRGLLQIQGLPFENLHKRTTAGPETPIDAESDTQATPSGDDDDNGDDNSTSDSDETNDCDNETAAACAGEDVPDPVEVNDEAVNEIANNDSAQREVTQVAVTAADEIHLPAQFISLAIAGGALLVGEVLQTPADSPMTLVGMTFSVTRQEVAGLILTGYLGFMLLAVALTMMAFRDVSPSRYYLARVEGRRDVSLSSVCASTDTFTRWYRERAGDRLMLTIHIGTLALIVVVHLI